MIEAEILADSVNPAGMRLITWKLQFPRFILAEFNTHRVFSRNAASSRAIPTDRWLQAVQEDPAMPVYWGANQSGMQAAKEVADVEAAKEWWREGARLMVAHAEKGKALKLHKQILNRPLEPWMHMTVIASATDYKGFFMQRAHKDAQPEFQELAYKMKALYESHKPVRLMAGEWHLPGISLLEQATMDEFECVKVSAARMAAVSYLRNEDQRPVDDWLELFDRLVGGEVRHLSPLEHPAKAVPFSGRLANFRGFQQLRASFEIYRG